MAKENQQNAVSLKLPTFWTSQPSVWFERQITADSTKYCYVVSSLNQETAGHIIDFLQHPPTDDKYGGIKKLLIGTFVLSRRARAARLLHMDDLGDRKPSMLMNEMLALMDGHAPSLLFEQLFLEQLPDDIHLILADETFTDPRQLAARADVLWYSKQQETSINLTTVNRTTRTFSSRTDEAKKTQTNYNDKWCRPPCTHPGNGAPGRR